MELYPGPEAHPGFGSVCALLQIEIESLFTEPARGAEETSKHPIARLPEHEVNQSSVKRVNLPVRKLLLLLHVCRRVVLFIVI